MYSIEGHSLQRSLNPALGRDVAPSRIGRKDFEAIIRDPTRRMEAEYYRNGGILPYVVRQLRRRAELSKNNPDAHELRL